MNTGKISNPAIFIKPSKKLINYIKNIRIYSELPKGISNIIFKNKLKKEPNCVASNSKKLLTKEDYDFINSLNLNSDNSNNFFNLPLTTDHKTVSGDDDLLNLQDLYWLYDHIRSNETEKVYLHELLEHSQIILPKNEEIPRSEELQKRCDKLKAQEMQKEYNNMTKNVDNVRKKHPEDTISYQLQQMNRHLIVIAQFVMSVIAGFAFGFIGVELLIGNLDFGFRLLLGIICSLIIALAELYFLAKKLNEDMQFDASFNDKSKSVKLD